MSYRSFKHLLGETSLERKCRFIFGLGILVLVSGSFFFYGQKTEEHRVAADDADGSDAGQPDAEGPPFQGPGELEFRGCPRYALSEDFKTIGDLPPHKAYVSILTTPKNRKSDRLTRTRSQRLPVSFDPPAPPRRLPPRERTLGTVPTRFPMEPIRGQQHYHQWQEGIPVYPGRRLQIVLSDGLSRDRRMMILISTITSGSRDRMASTGSDEGGRPGRRRGDQPADGADLPRRSTATAPC